MVSDEKLLSVMAKDGGRTWLLALKVRAPTAQIRRQLVRLERQGRVARVPRYSSVNDIYWQPLPEPPKEGV